MKNILFAIMLLLTFTVSAQTKDSMNYRKAKFGFVFSPGYCYRSLNYNAPGKWMEALRNHEEVPAYGFTTGLNFRLGLANKITFLTGLYYSVFGVQTKNIELQWTTPGSGYPVESKTKYHYKYLDIPVKINYLFGSGRTRFFISGGVSVNIFTEKKSNVISAFADGHTISAGSAVDLGYLKFNLAALIGLGIKYDLAKRISIDAEPVYRRFINSIVADKSAKEYPYSIGTNIEIFYALKKRK